ncbi:MAG: hypothetical protein KatS3mg108_3737 [Isosphaeraceae bacterium]|nr:MAG: hypothetical protein KatS3mg108_3737 [Isosphaeraceae bacterium]
MIGRAQDGGPVTMPRMTASRRELGLVALATLVGLALRGWNLSQLGLDHFDAGIYALGGLWVTSPRGLAALDPGLIPYAPPLQPIGIGLAYLLLGISDTSALLVSIVAGAAAIPVAAWLAWRAFGAGAGAAAAWLLALNGPHIAFSRSGLTDPLAALTLLGALVLGASFLERPRWVGSVLLGLAVGLAQNAKYSGFLAGVIVALAWLVGLVREGGGRGGAESARVAGRVAPGVERLPSAGSPLRTLVLGLLAALVAGICYAPWFGFVQSQPGGYGALLKHHAGYVSGWAGWPGAWQLQLSQAIALSGRLVGPLSWAGLAWVAAGLAAVIVRMGLTSPPVATMSRWVGLAAGAIGLAAAPNLAWWSALALSLGRLLNPRPAGRLVAIGWATLSLLTPLYQPYARLWLPIEALSLVLLSGLVAGGREGSPLETAEPKSRGRLVAVWVGCALLGLGQRARVADPLPGVLGPSDSVRAAVVGWEADRAGRPLRVLARPPVWFYLASRGLPFVRLESVASLAVPARAGDRAVVDTELLERGPDDGWQKLSLFWTIRSSAALRLSLPAALDANPTQAHRGATAGTAPEARLLFLDARESTPR